MKKFLLALLLAVAFPAFSQTVNSHVETELMRYAGNIHQFNSIFPQEKVFLQFDNTSYYTGETIWFKAFVVNASTHEKAGSRVLYVDLVSPEGVLLKQQKLKIVAGQADGSFPLLDGSTQQARELRGVLGYPSGFYEVRAYTNYMLNFGRDLVFSRVFAVYDKPEKEGGYYEESPVIKDRYAEVSQNRPDDAKLKDMNVTFYPEGGHLILNRPCRVAFKVTGANGLGIDATGVLNDNGLTFSTVHDGMGSFTFTPTEQNNSVRLTAGGNSRKFNLPHAETDGCAIQVRFVSPDSISMTLNPASDFKAGTLGLTLTCRGEIMAFSTIDVGNDEVIHNIGLGKMPEGVFRLTLFNNAGQILATRSFYHVRSDISGPSLEVTTDRESYGPFEKVTMSFNLHDGNGVPFRDRFCVGVRDIRGYGNIYRDDLRTCLLLSSDLKGLIENPSYYFNEDNEDRLQALDLLCLVQGWERYDWSQMAGVSDFQEKHRMEQGLTLNGWVLNPSGHGPLGDVEVNAGLMPKDKRQTETYTYHTDSTGYFGFDIGAEFYEKARFTISATAKHERRLGTPARLKFERSIIPPIRAYQPGEEIFVGNTRIRTAAGTVRPETETDSGLPVIIKAENGVLLPEVKIDEERKYIDFYTFQAYDVPQDVELELDKGDYSIDLYSYLLDKGYQVIMTMDDNGFDSLISINGQEPFVYVHNKSKYFDRTEIQEPSKIDTKDIRSIMVYDRPMLKMEAWGLAPLYMDRMSGKAYDDVFFTQEKASSILKQKIDKRKSGDSGPNDNTGNFIPGYDRVIMIDVLLKENGELSSRKDLFKINRRITTVDGYSTPYTFYSPEYPDGPVYGEVDYRRTLYWNPNVVTDTLGQATIEFYNNSQTTRFNVSGCGITAGGTPYVMDVDF